MTQLMDGASAIASIVSRRLIGARIRDISNLKLSPPHLGPGTLQADIVRIWSSCVDSKLRRGVEIMEGPLKEADREIEMWVRDRKGNGVVRSIVVSIRASTRGRI